MHTETIFIAAVKSMVLGQIIVLDDEIGNNRRNS
jgi:hypothetical protein